MKFGSLEYLYLVWILPAMVLLAVYSFRKKDQLLRQFVDPHLWGRLVPEGHRRRQILKFVILGLGVSLLLMGFLRPRWGFHWEEIRRKGVDLLVAVDVSESMLAEDIKPNRLESAKREVTDLVNLLEGDRIGLIAFAGASFLQCPLTLDKGAFKMFLDYLDTSLIPVPGTDLGQAIETAVKSFVPGRRASRALILITDGEDHSRETEKWTEEAGKKGIRIFTVGIGSEQGAPIPLQDGSGGFKKDRKGQVIMTRLGESALQKIALSTGGSYVRSKTGDMDLKEIYQEVRGRLQAEELETTKRRRWEERFQWFLFAGILLLALECLLPERKNGASRPAASGRRFLWPGSRFPWPGRARSPAILLPSVLMLSFSLLAPSHGSAESVYSKIDNGEKAYQDFRYDESLKEFLDAQVERPEDVRLQYNIGGAHYRMGNYEEAEASFRNVAAVAADPLLEGKALYNLGNSSYRQGKLEEAVAYYQRALEIDPEDEDCRFNLEFVREEIKRRINEAKERQQQQQEQQKQEGQSCPPRPRDSQDQGGQKPEQQGQQQEQQQAGQDQQQARPEQQPQAQSPREPTGAGESKEQQQAAEGGQTGAEPATAMTAQEAERWLNSLEDEQKQLAEQQARKAIGKGDYRPDKDW